MFVFIKMECNRILLKHWVDHGGEGVILDSHGEGDLTMLKKLTMLKNLTMLKKIYNVEKIDNAEQNLPKLNKNNAENKKLQNLEMRKVRYTLQNTLGQKTLTAKYTALQIELS